MIQLAVQMFAPSGIDVFQPDTLQTSLQVTLGLPRCRAPWFNASDDCGAVCRSWPCRFVPNRHTSPYWFKFAHEVAPLVFLARWSSSALIASRASVDFSVHSGKGVATWSCAQIGVVCSCTGIVIVLVVGAALMIFFFLHCMVARRIVSLAHFFHGQRFAALFGPRKLRANVTRAQATSTDKFRRSFCACVSR